MVPVLAMNKYALGIVIALVSGMAVIAYHLARNQGVTSLDLLLIGFAAVNAVLYFGFDNKVLLDHIDAVIYTATRGPGGDDASRRGAVDDAVHEANGQSQGVAPARVRSGESLLGGALGRRFRRLRPRCTDGGPAVPPLRPNCGRRRARGHLEAAHACLSSATTRTHDGHAARPLELTRRATTNRSGVESTDVVRCGSAPPLSRG